MRTALLVLLLLASPTSVLVAQTIGDDEYTAHLNQQVEDYWSLFSLQEMIGVVMTENDSVNQVSNHDQGMLLSVASDTLRTVVRMRQRGQAMFAKVEHNYEQYCLKGVPDPLPCSAYKETYRAMIADTLMLGSVYYTVSEDSWEVLSVLKK